MPLEHLKQQNNHKRRSAPLCSPAMITSIIIIDDWYPPSTLISSFMMYDLWKFWSDWLQPPPWWSVHLSQGRRSSSVTSKITCRAAVDHSPTSISDIRAVFHLWATYVILNIAKGKVALSQDSCCVYYFSARPLTYRRREDCCLWKQRTSVWKCVTREGKRGAEMARETMCWSLT